MSDDGRFITEVKMVTDTLEMEGVAARRFQIPLGCEDEDSPRGDDSRTIIGAANTVLELGHPSTTSICLGMITEREDLVAGDGVVVMGDELYELPPGRHSFALIVLSKVVEATESSRRALSRKLSVCDRLSGVMARVALGKIWIRISQEALDRDVTLKVIGYQLLSEIRKEQETFGKTEVILIAAEKNHIEKLRPVTEKLARETRERYKTEIKERGECENGLDCDDCPENEICQILKDAVAVSRKKKRQT